MAPVETEYYDLLDVPTDADDTVLRKAYRKQAMLYHPDKNPSADAEEKFKDISKAYQVLSDSNLRAVYDKNGKIMTDKEGPVTMEDAAGFFANVFGGERFVDYIGEISIMKDVTNTATSMMTEEEKVEIEKQMNSSKPNGSFVSSVTSDAKSEMPPVTTSSQSTPAHTVSHDDSTKHATPTAVATESSSTPGNTSHIVLHGSISPNATAADKDRERREAARRKAEQREKLREHDKARRKAMEQRVATLTTKMIERLRPFVEAKDPGGSDDPESMAFAEKMKREVEDLKLESFGVELLHTIGSVYMMKASSFMKSRKFLGIPGFFSRIREKGSLAKDVWGVIGSALSLRDLMIEMEKAQARGDVDEQELRALEMDVTGKLMLASWRGARLEVVQVLREVVENVLKEPGQPETVLINRAKALLVSGAIFKAAVPDGSDEERRLLERMVHEAALPKPKQHGIRVAKPRREEMHKHAEASTAAKEKSQMDGADHASA